MKSCGLFLSTPLSSFLSTSISNFPHPSHTSLLTPSPFSTPPRFVQMSNKRSNSFRRAILQGSRQLKGCSLRDEVGLGLSQRLVRHVAYETLPREVDRKWYFDSYTYCPPPWLILAITIAEVNPFVARDQSARHWTLLNSCFDQQPCTHWFMGIRSEGRRS